MFRHGADGSATGSLVYWNEESLMPTVTEQATLPADVDPTRCRVEVQLYQADRTILKEARDTVSGETVVGRHELVLDGTTASSPAEGAWSLVLPGNSTLTPSGTVWGRTLSGPRVPSTLSYATVSSSGGPFQWKAIETDPPVAIDPAGLAAHAADSLLHGGGQLLAYADRATSFTTASTSATDVTGVTITFVVPEGPYVVECGAFGLIEEGRAGQIAVASGSRTGGVTTLTTGAAHGLTQGRVAYVTVADTTYNGSWALATGSGTTLTYNQTGVGNDASSGVGTVADVGTPGAGGTIQITLSDNTIIGQDGGRAKVDNDLMFLNRRTPAPNAHHVPTPGATVTYKLRSLSSAASSDFSLIGGFFGFDDQPYLMAYTLGEGA